MKRRWKILWILCLCMAAAGVSLCAVGAATGGFSEIEYLSLAGWDAETAEHRGNAEKLGTFTEIDRLQIQISHVNLVIEAGDSPGIEVYGENLDEKYRENLEVKQKGSTLEIETTDQDFWKRGQKDNAAALVVHLPEKQQFTDASLVVGAGILEAEKVLADRLEITIGAGRGNIEEFQAKNAEISVGAGEASVRGSVTECLAMDCGLGSLVYTDIGKYEDYNYELSCGLGALNVKDNAFAGIAGERTIANNAGKEMHIQCGLGTVDVTFEKGE